MFINGMIFENMLVQLCKANELNQPILTAVPFPNPCLLTTGLSCYMCLNILNKFVCWFKNTKSQIISAFYLPDLVIIISVPSSWNLSHSSFVSRLQEILAISSLGTPGLVGMSGSVHNGAPPPLLLPLLKSPWVSSEGRSARFG